MGIRLNCRACRNSFVSPDDRAGRRVSCPHCGEKQVAPGPAVRVLPGDEPVAELVVGPSVYSPAEAPRRGGALRTVGLGVLIGLLVATVAVVVAWPELSRRWHPIPPDPIVSAATDYLQALVDGN